MVTAPYTFQEKVGHLRLQKGALAHNLAETLLQLEHSIDCGAVAVLASGNEHLPTVRHALQNKKRVVLATQNLKDEKIIKLSRRRRTPHWLPIRALKKSSPHYQWSIMNEANARGINTVTFEACGELQFLNGAAFTFSVMKSLRTLPTLPEYLSTLTFDETDNAQGVATASSLCARILLDAHRRGFFHSDIKGYHLLVDAASSPTLSWIWLDLDDVQLCSRLSQAQVVENLYQMWRYVLEPLGRQSLEVFLEHYLRLYKGQAAVEMLTSIKRMDTSKLQSLVDAHYRRRVARASRRKARSLQS